MIPSRLEIDRLVKRVSSDPLEREAALGLIYQLLDPAVPSFLAEILIDNPTLTVTEKSSFIPNLAYGVVDGCLEYRSENERVNLARKIFRQLTSTSFYNPQNKAGQELSDVVCQCYWSLYKGFLAAEQIAADREIPNFELSVLVEELISNLASHTELLIILLQNRLNCSRLSVRTRLYTRIVPTAKSALENEPISPSEIIFTENQFRFASEKLNDEPFKKIASNIDDYLMKIFKP